MANSAIVGILKVLLTADTAQYNSAMSAAAATAAKTQKDFAQIGRQATQIGSALTRTLTLPLLALGGGAVKVAMDFQSSFAGVRKTVEATDAEFKVMEQGFRDLAKTIPVNVNELNRLGEAAGALGIPKEEVVDFARVMALLGVTTNLTSDAAAEGIAKIQNIFGAAGKDTERFASTLVALGNDGASTEAEILEMSKRIAGAGNAIGMTQGEVMAFGSALSSVGIEAEMGGSAISRVFIDIASAVSAGGAELEGFAKTSGKSVEEFAKLFKEDAATAVNSFIVGLSNVKKSGGDLIQTIQELGFTEIRVRDTLLRAAGAGDVLTKALKLQAEAWEQNKALTNEANERFKTTESQLKLLGNKIADIGIQIGNALLPMIMATIAGIDKILPSVAALAKGFEKMPLPLQVMVVGFFGLLAAAGPVIWVFGQLATAASAVAGAFAEKGIATRALNAILPRLGAVIAPIVNLARLLVTGFLALSAPIMAVVGSIGVLAYAWARMTGDWTRAFDVLFPPLGILRAGWDKLKDAMQPHAQLLKDIAQIVSSTLTVAWFVFKNLLEDFYSATLGKVVTGFNMLKEAVKVASEWISTKAVAAFQAFKDAVKDIPGFTLLLAIFERMKSTGDGAKKVIHDMALGFKEMSDSVSTTEAPLVKMDGLVKNLPKPLEALATGLEIVGRQGELSGKAMADMLAKNANFTGQLADTKVATAALSEEQKKQIRAGLELGISTDLIASKLEVSVGAVDRYKESLQGMAGAHKKSADAAEENLKKISALEAKIADENTKFRDQAIKEVDDKKRAEREYYNWLGERRMEDDQRKLPIESTMDLSKLYAPLKDTRYITQNLPKSQQWEQAWSGMREGFKANLADIPGTLIRAFEGGGDIWGAVKSIGTQIGSGIGGAIGFGIGGPAGAKIGEAIGSLVGPAMEGFKKLFGIGINSEIKKFNKEIDKSRASLIEEYGSLENIARIGKKVGVDLAGAWNHQGKAGKEAFDKMAAAFRAAVEKMERDAEEAVSNIKSEISDLEGQLSSTMDEAREMGYIFDKNGKFVSVRFQAMESAAKEFGVEVSSLGKSFQAARLADGAMKIINAFDLLTRGGVDAGTILFGMKDEISKLVQESIKFGTTIPANMRPWIQNLIDTGQLLDEDGRKITDIGKIKFGEPVKTQFEEISTKIGDLITKIGELVDKLTNELIPALQEASRNRNAHISITTDPIPNIDPYDPRRGEGGGGGEGIPLSSGTYGRLGRWFGNFPKSGMNAILHGTEAVVTTNQAVPFAMDVLAGLGARAPQQQQQAPVNDRPVVVQNSVESRILLDGHEMKRWILDEVNNAIENNTRGMRSRMRDNLGITT